MRKLAFFIDDMRLMYNISNEYKIYDRQINNEKLDRNNLLALITYKNIFPRDFANLQYRRGFIYSIFENKKTFIESRLQIIDDKIELYKAEIKILNKEFLESVTELTALYLKTDDIVFEADFTDSPTHVEFVRNLLEHEEVNRLEYIEESKKNPYNGRRENIIRKENKTVNLDEIIVKMEKNTEYIRRKDLIEKKINSRISDLEKLINNLLEERSNVKILPISESLDKENYSKLLEEHASIESSEYRELLYLLIEEGYINETYNEYMNYFYGTHFSIDEKMFVTNLLVNGKSDYELPLKNFALISAHLTANDYRRPGILNYDLVEYFLETNKRENLESLISVAAINRNIDFILTLYHYLDTKEKISEIKYFKLFLETLNNTWKDFYLVTIIEKNILSERVIDNDKEAINNLIFGSLSLTDFHSSLNGTNFDQVTSYINEKNSLLLKVEEYDASNFDYLYSNLKELNIKFKELDFSEMNSDIVSFIIEENIYKLSIENIKEICLHENILQDSEIDKKDFKGRNLTYIRNSTIEPLKVRVENEINDYLASYIEFSGNNIYEDNEVVAEVLNRDDVTVKKQFISAIQVPLKKISDIRDTDLWKKLLETRNIEPTIDNIVSYFIETDKWAQELIDFVNGTHEPIQVNYQKTLKDYGETGFFLKTFDSNELNDSHYRSIVGCSGYVVKEFSKGDLDLSKVKILIEESAIEITTNNLKYVDDNYPTEVVNFAKKNLENHTEVIANSLSDIKLIELIRSKINPRMVDDLLTKRKRPISLREFDIRSKIFEKILTDYLDKKDIPYLFENYSRFNSSVKEKVLVLAMKNKDIVASCEEDKNLILDLLKSEEVKINEKEALMINKIDLFDFKNILDLVPLLDLSEGYNEISEGSNPKFENNDINQTIIKHLEKNDLISSFKIDSNNKIRVYSKRK